METRKRRSIVCKICGSHIMQLLFAAEYDDQGILIPCCVCLPILRKYQITGVVPTYSMTFPVDEYWYNGVIKEMKRKGFI